MSRPVVAGTSVIVAVMGLGACGGTSDKDKIAQIIKAYGAEPTRLCTTFGTPSLIRLQFGSTANCLDLASRPGAKDPALKVDSVTVKGTTALAIRTSGSYPGKGTKAAVHLVKTAGGWKIASIDPAP